MSQATKYLAHDFVTELIELYRLHPCLWKVKSEDYFNKAKKQAAYEEMAEPVVLLKSCLHGVWAIPRSLVRGDNTAVTALRASLYRVWLA